MIDTELYENNELQEIASGVDSEYIAKNAVCSYSFDTNDPYDCAGLHLEGIEDGLKIAQALFEKGSDAKAYKITFNDYVEDDGITIYVGTFDDVKAQLLDLREKFPA